MLNRNKVHKLSWKQMLDHSPKGNGFAFGLIYGWVYYLLKLLDIKSLSLEFLVKLGEGVLSAVVIGFAAKLTTTFFEERVKDKIFKPKKNAKPKAMDDQQAA